MSVNKETAIKEKTMEKEIIERIMILSSKSWRYDEIAKALDLSFDLLIKYVSICHDGKELLKKQRVLLADQIAELQKALEKLDSKIENYDTAILSMEKETMEDEQSK